MTENFCWSASAGRWVGIPVRVHVSLFLFVTLIFGVQSTTSDTGAGTAFVTMLCLFVAVLLHELAHIFALTNLGGHVNNIVFTAWGGNSDFSLPRSAKSQAIVYLTGPFFSGCLFLLGAMLLLQTDHATLRELTNPFLPNKFDPTEWEVTFIKIATWVNFQLMIVNLIPCFPFDGAGLFRSTINSLSSDVPPLRREATTMVLGYAVGFTLLGVGWFLGDYQSPVGPVWLTFTVAAIMLMFAARYSYYENIVGIEESWDELDDLDYESVYEDSSFFDFPSEDNSSYSQWLMEKQEERDRKEREVEKREKEMADEILKKLHSEGIESLAEDEKEILNRVSARLRRSRETGTGADVN